MWLGTVLRVAKIELKKIVIGAGKDYRASVGVSAQLSQILGAESVKKIRVAAEQSGDCSSEIGRTAPDHSIEPGATAIVRRVRHDLDRRSPIPSPKTEASGSHRWRRRLAKLGQWNSLQLVRREYQHLCGGIEKLRGQSLVEPEDSR
jgi:hypothetical protein